MEDEHIKRGDVFYFDLNSLIGSEQGGLCPVLVIRNDAGNHLSHMVIAATVTS